MIGGKIKSERGDLGHRPALARTEEIQTDTREMRGIGVIVIKATNLGMNAGGRTETTGMGSIITEVKHDAQKTVRKVKDIAETVKNPKAETVGTVKNRKAETTKTVILKGIGGTVILKGIIKTLMCQASIEVTEMCRMAIGGRVKHQAAGI